MEKLNIELKKEDKKIIDDFNKNLALEAKKNALKLGSDNLFKKNINVITTNYITFLSHLSTAVLLVNESKF